MTTQPQETARERGIRERNIKKVWWTWLASFRTSLDKYVSRRLPKAEFNIDIAFPASKTSPTVCMSLNFDIAKSETKGASLRECKNMSIDVLKWLMGLTAQEDLEYKPETNEAFFIAHYTFNVMEDSPRLSALHRLKEWSDRKGKAGVIRIIYRNKFQEIYNRLLDYRGKTLEIELEKLRLTGQYNNISKEEFDDLQALCYGEIKEETPEKPKEGK